MLQAVSSAECGVILNRKEMYIKVLILFKAAHCQEHQNQYQNK